VQGLDHDWPTAAWWAAAIEVIDLYATDAEIPLYRLRVLRDDRRLFPRYDAVLVHRLDAERRLPAAFAALRRLERPDLAAAMSAR
jgi:osmoprotectant transport system permease protein